MAIIREDELLNFAEKLMLLVDSIQKLLYYELDAALQCKHHGELRNIVSVWKSRAEQIQREEEKVK